MHSAHDTPLQIFLIQVLLLVPVYGLVPQVLTTTYYKLFMSKASEYMEKTDMHRNTWNIHLH